MSTVVVARARLILERVGIDGARDEIVPGPREIHAAVTSLDASRDRMLRLHGTHDDGATFDLRVMPDGDAARVSLERDGALRWLARLGDDLGATTRVPRTWASSTLALATMQTGWPRTLPWHDASFAPVGALRLDDVSFPRCVASPEPCVARLAAVTTRFLQGGGALADVIAELRRVGHDLWSLDDHDDGQTWGADYMRRAQGQGLLLEIRTAPPFSTFARFGDAEATSP